MTLYMLRRLAQAVVVALIVSVIVFGLLHALPGGLVRAQLGPRASAAAVHQLALSEGLLKPLPVQYGIWLANALTGNLGFSYKLNQPVAILLAEYLPRTALLVGTALALAVAISVPLGMFQAQRRNHLDDDALSAAMLLFYSTPSFLLGVVLIVVFNIWLPVLPATAASFSGNLAADAAKLALPMLTLCLGSVSYFSRYMRSSTIDNLLEDYVRTAHAKGASQRRVLLRHVLRNSVLSTVTLIGLSLPYVLSGALIVEALFDYPGIGLLFWNAAQTRDYPVLLAVVLVVTLATVIGNMLADIAYGVLDPRIRYR
ncbi:MAG: ABC transporter permease [Acidimicrobiales bacterium]